MDLASDIRRILAPWYTEGAYSTQRQPFISRDQILSLRRYAYYNDRLHLYYNQLCPVSLRYHLPLRSLLNAPSYTGLASLVRSGNDWRMLDRDLLDLGTLLLHETQQLASEGEQLLKLIEKMDFMEQYGYTIGDLTEEMLRELESRPLSPNDVLIRNSLSERLWRMTLTSLIAAVVAHIVENDTFAFSADLRRTILPSMERLRAATLAEPCAPHPNMTTCVSNREAVAAQLNTSLHSGTIDAAATTLHDLAALLTTYLKSASEDLHGMDTQLVILLFAIQFNGVIEAWQSVEPPLQDLISALRP